MRRALRLPQNKGVHSTISPFVDLLEDRVLLSVTPVLSGRTVTFTGDAAADNLSLRVTPEGVLQYSTDGTNYSSNLGGSSTLTVTAADSISVNLGAGNDALTVDASLSTKLTAVGATLSFVGGGQSGDRLVGPSQESTWDISGDGAGTVGAITFSGVKNLTGGTGADSFDFSGVGSAVMTIDAGRGDNTLISPGGTQTWNLTGKGTGTVGSLSFSGVLNLVGGSSNDTYVFASGSLGSFSIDETAGGTETIDLSAISSDITFDLSSASAQALNSDLTLTLSATNVIENVIGGSGADRITGNELANAITGGAGNDTLVGGFGDDVYLFGSGSGTDVITENVGSTSGGGIDKIDTSAVSDNTTVSKLSDGTFTLAFAGNRIAFDNVERLAGGTGTNTLDFSASTEKVFVNLTTQVAADFTLVTGYRNVIGSDFDDILVGNESVNSLSGGKGNDRFSGQGGADSIDGGTGYDSLLEVRDGNFVLTNGSLSFTSSGISETDTLSVIDSASLAGELGNNLIDASAFRPLLTTTDLAGLNLGAGADLAANDLKLRLRDGSFVNVNLAGAVTINDLLNAIVAAAPSGVTLTATLNTDSNAILVTQTAGSGAGNLTFTSTSTLAADLGLNVTGSGATLLSLRTIAPGVTLDGGSTVPLSALNNGVGVRTTDELKLTLRGNESTTLLSVLNQGAGVRTVNGTDFQVTLTDGKTFNVDLNSSMTLQQAFDAITTAANAVAPNRLTIEVDPKVGTYLVLRDSADAGGDLKVSSLNGSFAADDLGLLVGSNGAKLEGAPIGEISADLRITFTDGETAEFDLSGVTTLSEIVTRFNSFGDGISVTVNSSGTGLVVRDLSGGPGNLKIEALNGSQAASDLGILGTGTGGVINGTNIVSGSLRLDGRNDADTLIGSSGDDLLITGGGGDSLAGGAGLDTLITTRDANMTLGNTTLSFGSGDSTSHSGIEQARLTGGDSANAINSTAFSLGSVTLIGGAGNDTLTGGSGDDVLHGGAGADALDGQGGTDSIVEGGQRVVIDSQGNGVGGSATLDLAEGTNEVVTVSFGAGVTGGNFQLTFNGETTASIPFDATSFDVKSELSFLDGLDREDLIVSRASETGPFTITFVGAKGGLNVSDLTASSVDLVGGGVTAAVTTQGVKVLNTLTSIETATLYGTRGNDLIDASAFFGTTFISGYWGNDTLIGSSNADEILGGDDDDRITGGGGADTLDGENGIDTIVESRDVNFTLTNATLTETGGALGATTEVDTIASFEWVKITGGSSGNTIDLSAFTGLTSDTYLDLLRNGDGLGATSGTTTVLTGSEKTMPLSVLNNGAGVRVSAGTDFVLVLRNGTTKSVDLGTAVTLQDAFDAIHSAAPSVTAALDSTGTAIVLTDTTAGAGNLHVQAATNTATDLGLVTTGVGGVLTGLPISDGSSDVIVTLSDGTRVGVELSYIGTFDDAFDAFTEASDKLAAAFDAGRTRIVLTDTAGGSSPITVTAVNGSMAGVALGLIGAGVTSSAGSLTGALIGVAQAAIDGGAGADSIIGTMGDDTITGGTGNDTIAGGSGINTLVEQRNANMTLGASTLVIGGETDSFTSIQRAELTGGTGANTIDASLFAGSAILSTGGGLDTLKGPLGDATFIVSIDGLTAPTSASDTAHQVTIHPAGGSSTYEILKSDSAIRQKDLWWINTVGSMSNVEYQLQSAQPNQTFVILEDIDVPGYAVNVVLNTPDLVISAERVEIRGERIRTATNGDAGDISILAKTIIIDGGATIDARTSSLGKSSGTITIAAVDDKARITGGPVGAQANIDRLNTSINIGAAEIYGGDITIRAVADSRFLLGNRDFAGNSASDLGKKIGSIAVQTITEAFPLLTQVSHSRSIADI